MLFDEEMMLLAIEQAKIAASLGEIPVGAVITDSDGNVVSEGYNTRESEKDPLGHAEISAIKKAASRLGKWRLSDCTIYVTLEPCPMCAGAIMNARIKRIVYGAFDEKGGAVSSVFNIFDLPFGYNPMIRSRILEEECGSLIKEFFGKLRTEKGD